MLSRRYPRIGATEGEHEAIDSERRVPTRSIAPRGLAKVADPRARMRRV